MPLVATVRPMGVGDVAGAAHVHGLAFPHQTGSLDWMRCSVAAYPKSLAFIYEANAEILAYAIWTQRSGFREAAVLELEQIAVLPEQQGQGIGTRLIGESLALAKSELGARGAELKAVTVSTRADGSALRLYQRTLGAEHVATIPDLYSADEALLVARIADSET